MFAAVVFGACTAEEKPAQRASASPTITGATSTRAPATPASGPSAVPSAWPGETCRPPEGPSTSQAVAFGTGTGPFCVAWLDRFSDETGFRIELTYTGSTTDGAAGVTESFSYDVGPDVVEFVFPASDGPRLIGSVDECLKRQSYTVSVTARRAAGDSLVGEMAVSAECSGNR